jgi:O-antigen ligase
VIVIVGIGAVLALILAAPIAARLFLASVDDPVGTALPVYALLLPFGSGIHVPLPLPSAFASLSSLVGGWAIVALALHIAATRRALSTHVVTCTLFVMMLGVLAFTYLWSINPATTSENLFVLVSIVLLFVLGALIEVDPRSLRRVEAYAIFGAVVACAYGVWLLRTGRLVSHDQGPARFATAGGAGDQADPNITAATLVFPFLLALLWTLRERRMLLRAGTLMATVLIGFGILLTGSRGGGLAVVAGSLIVASEAGGRNFIKAALGLAISAAVILTLLPNTISARFGQATSTGRTQVWSVGLHACSTYCWRGSGWGTYPDVYMKTVLATPRLAPYYGILQLKAHNMWLELLIEGGVLALVLAALGIASLLRTIWRLPGAQRTAPLAGVIALLVCNEFLSNFGFKYFWFVLLYAALAANVRPGVSSPDDRRVAAGGTRGSFALRDTRGSL